MDPRDNLEPAQDDDPGQSPPPPGASSAAADWYRRPWGITAIAVGALAAGIGITLGAVALTDGDDPPAASATTPPAETQSAEPSASATPTPTPTPSETTPPPDVEPEPPAVPGLDACGTAAPVIDHAAALWVGDYGGGIDGDVGIPLDLRWSAIIGEDWSDRAVTANIVGLWLVSENGTVVGVPSTELPDSVPLAMNAGSEGEGSGSEGVIQLATQFVACPNGPGGLPPAMYLVRISVDVDAGTTTQQAIGDIPMYLPDYDTAMG